MSDYWSQYDGKSVPLKGLLQWLSDEHEHVTDDEGELREGWDFPVVNSMALQRWAIVEAVENEYEFAVQGENLYRGGTYCSPWFRNRAWAEGYLEEAKELPKFFGPVKEEYGKFKIVKRRKAGEVEDA